METLGTIIISRCILGESVRYDGGDKNIPWLNSTPFINLFDVMGVCPEVEMQMGVPRPPIQWENVNGEDLLLEVESKTNWTSNTNLFLKEFAQKIQEKSLLGAILQSNSPSCGNSMIPLFRGKSVLTHRKGFFADWLADQFLGFPIIESKHSDRKENIALFLLYAFVRKKILESKNLEQIYVLKNQFVGDLKVLFRDLPKSISNELDNTIVGNEGDEIIQTTEQALRELNKIYLNTLGAMGSKNVESAQLQTPIPEILKARFFNY